MSAPAETIASQPWNSSTTWRVQPNAPDFNVSGSAPSTAVTKLTTPKLLLRCAGSVNCSDHASVHSGNPGPNCRGEAVRIISAEREFSAIAQRDRHGVKAGNIKEPAARR